MKRKTGITVNLIGAICCIVFCWFNMKYNLVVKAGLPVEASALFLLWELLHVFFFNYYLNETD